MTTTNLINAAQHQIADKLAFAQVSKQFVIEAATDNINTIIGIDGEEEIVGRQLSDLFYEFIGSEDFVQSVLEGRHKVFKLERINRYLPSGEMIYLDFTISIMLQSDESAMQSLLLTVEDATIFGRLEQAIVQERNELRLAKQKLATVNGKLRKLDHLKSLFFSMAAHDLRAPLMVIRGYADLLNSMITRGEFQNDEPETPLEFVKTISVQSDWLDNIIHNVLDLNQIENDELHLQMVNCDINSLIQETVAMLQPMATLNSQRLLAEYADEMLFVHADPQRIQQIMQNLIGNAIKYTPPNGEIWVRLSAENNKVVVHVEDNGRGMTQKQVSEVFEIYYRTSDARQSKVQGTGLGLFIVKTLIRAQNGDIDVSSDLNKGTTFRFWLPQLQDFSF